MKPLTIFLLAFTFLIGVFIAVMVEEGRLRKQKAQAVEVAKQQAVREYKLNDSLRVEHDLRISLEKSYILRGDTLATIKTRKNAIQIVIRSIHPLPLPPHDLERVLTKRYADQLAD